MTVQIVNGGAMIDGVFLTDDEMFDIACEAAEDAPFTEYHSAIAGELSPYERRHNELISAKVAEKRATNN